MTRTALITGCSSGIGRATARAFLDAGWRVHATARDPDEVPDAAAATVSKLDVTDDGDVDRVVDRTLEEAGRIDCLVNNAGYGQFGPLEDVPTEAVRDQFDVNVFGPHRLARAVLPHMRERGTGTVVNVGSVDDRLPLAGIGAYAGSKFALAGMSAALRQEVAGHGVDVVVVEPGLVATDFYDRALADLPSTDRSAAYDDVYRVLDRIGVFADDVPGVADPAAVASVIVEAATADAPDPRYQAGPLGTPGVLAAELLPRAWRDRAVRAGVALAASGPVRRAAQWADDWR
ncbi:SDR family oxidoreductase [Candidatus Halobonum tyrrellensis]|uniref:Oxidoreductase n=1 Tax=Candidatus Halobonum tyrrellensis G22 TaxID=1324957 RepID=V4HG92_9EURY|nr:SDR family oxidoreductase [Candidatus Halobonum tyrrellensis]ESP89138.1 oxidoreductase [Candidatus Halobonum tyrrellensis G22]